MEAVHGKTIAFQERVSGNKIAKKQVLEAGITRSAQAFYCFP